MAAVAEAAAPDSGPARAAGLLTAALLLGVVVRLAFILLPRVPLETKAVTSIGDSREYVALAQNLVSSHTFTRDTVLPFRPELFRTPTYPLFLALPLIAQGWLQRLLPVGVSFIALALALQLLLALLTVRLTWRLALELGLRPVAAAFAAFLVGLSPNLAFLSTKLTSESLFTPMLLICVLLLNRYRLSGRVLDLIGTGVCCGLLAMTRPIATFFPVVVVVYVLWLRLTGRNPVSAIGHSVLLAVCVSVVVAPWVIRNGRRTGRYIISTASEHNIYLYDAATVLAAEKGITIPQARDLMMAEAQVKYGRVDTTDEATMWQKLAAIARPHFLRKPALAAPIWLFGVAADFLNPISVGPLLIHSGASPAAGSANLLQSSLALLVKGKVTQAFTRAWQVRAGGAPLFILVVLACAALFNIIVIWLGFAGLFLRRTRCLLWLLLPILYFTLVTGTVGDARFRAPIEPLLCILAAAVLVRRPRQTATASCGTPSDRVLDRDGTSCSTGLATTEAGR